MDKKTALVLTSVVVVAAGTAALVTCYLNANKKRKKKIAFRFV